MKIKPPFSHLPRVCVPEVLREVPHRPEPLPLLRRRVVQEAAALHLHGHLLLLHLLGLLVVELLLLLLLHLSELLLHLLLWLEGGLRLEGVVLLRLWRLLLLLLRLEGRLGLEGVLLLLLLWLRLL